jgi:hypothetical protein
VKFIFSIGIVARKQKMKGGQKTRTNTRGMLNVKGLDLEDDDDFANRQ